MKILLILAMLALCLPAVFSDISGFIMLGEEKSYIIPEKNFTISLLDFNPLTERLSFRIDGMLLDVLPSQKRNVTFANFEVIGYSGQSKSDFSVSFTFSNIGHFECVKKCKENMFIDFMRYFDPEFNICTEDCNAGCKLYMEDRCVAGEEWIMSNCGEKLSLLSDNCTSPRKKHTLQCISDSDCKSLSCHFGMCINSTFSIGDALCELPSEPCSSPDCTCSSVPVPKKTEGPIILFHGFTSSPDKMKNLQRRLSIDLHYADGGELTLEKGCKKTDRNTVYTASYYIGDENKRPLEILVGASYYQTYSNLKSTDASLTFRDTFSRIIEKARQCSNSDKVTIIAHSMGGIIARSYILEGNNAGKVHKLVLLASPNKGGVYGNQKYELVKGLEAELGDRKDLLSKCASAGLPSVVLSLMDGRDVTGECQQMQQANTISNPILEHDETPGIVEYYTIAGNVDGKGDGVVTMESAALDGADNRIVECDHFSLRDPLKCRASYLEVIKSLGYSEDDLKKPNIIDRILGIFP